MLPLVFDVLVEHEAGERGVGARDVGADVADDERDLVGLALGGQRALAASLANLTAKTMTTRTSAMTRPAAAAPPRRQSNRTASPSPDHRSM